MVKKNKKKTADCKLMIQEIYNTVLVSDICMFVFAC